MTTRSGKAAGDIVGAIGFNIFPSFLSFEQELATGVVNATVAKTAFIGKTLENMGKKVFARFTVPLAIATAANIAQFQALDREIRTVLTLFGTAPSLIDSTFQEMRDGIAAVSEEVGGLEKDLADGLYQAISAGVPRGGVFDFLEVAEMAAIADKTADLTTAVDGLTTVTNAFGLEAKDAGEIADVMFATVALGKTTFGELANDIGRVAPLAANAGVEFQELFAIVGALTLQGLKTSEAISFLRAGITGLLRPTEELNEVFKEFGSAEAAIPIIGLQGAFDLVVEAVGGSTSKLQELIGTSEGVSAILGVTGQNAGNFAKGMAAVEQSAGSASRAFEIMDESVGRAFGSLTEAFDRLGNTFGELGAELVVPFVGALDNLVSALARGFKALKPFAEQLGGVFAGLLKLLELPVIKQFVQGFATVVIAVGGLIGVFGGLLLVMGKILFTTAQTVFGLSAFKTLKGPILGVAGAISTLGVSMENTARSTTRLTGAMGALRGPMKGVGKTLQFLSGGFIGQLFVITAITTAAVAAFGIYTKWNEKQKELNSSTQIFTDRLDVLLDDAGLVNQKITFDGLNAADDNIRSFIVANELMIQSLNTTRELLGSDALEAQILSIGAEMIWKGNTAEATLDIINQLAAATGITIDIELGDFETPKDVVDAASAGAEVTARVIATQLQEQFDRDDFFFGPKIRGSIESLGELAADELAASMAIGEGDLGLDNIRAIFDILPEGLASTEFLQSVRDTFAEIRGVDLGGVSGTLFTDMFGGQGDQDVEALVKQLKDLAGIDLVEEMNLAELQKVDPSDFKFLSGLREDIDETLPVVEEFTDEMQAEADAILGVTEGLGEALANSREFIKAELEAISQHFIDQIPVFEVYKGAADIDLGDFLKGQDLFQADLAAIAEFRTTTLAGMPEEIRTAFDTAPVSDQAWLAQLSPENAQKALDELVESLDATKAAGDIIGQHLAPEILAEATVLFLAEAEILAQEAEDAGSAVKEAFDTELILARASWPAHAKAALNAINSTIAEHIFPTPPLPPPQFTDEPTPTLDPAGDRFQDINASGPGDITVNINDTTTLSTEEAAEQALALAQTTRLMMI